MYGHLENNMKVSDIWKELNKHSKYIKKNFYHVFKLDSIWK